MSHARIIRTVLFFGLAAFILIAPAWPNLSPKRPRWLRPWMMYHDVGVGFCAVEMKVSDSGGVQRRISVKEATDLVHDRTSGRILLRTWQAYDLAHRFATNLPPGDQLTVVVREAQRSGWEVRRDKTPVPAAVPAAKEQP